MASSGTINGTPSGTQPYLRISWSILSQDIPNNRSRVRLQLILVAPYSLNFSASKTGSNNGASFTYTGGFSGTGTRTLNTRDIWVNHNSDGTRTQSVNGSFNIQINWQGSHLSSLSVSGSMNLDTIPRSSEVTAFSMGSALQISTANSVNVRLNVYSSSFRFDLSLRYGSTTIASWSGENFSHNTTRSLSLTSGQVNNLLSAMRTTTSGTVTIRVQTRASAGGSSIGSVQTRNATASVHSNVTPTATGLSIGVRGSGRDSVINKYVQGISRMDGSFNATARGGAFLVSNRIYVRRTDGAGASTIHGASGYSGILTQSGTYEAVAETVDSRGRSATQRTTFTVHAYSPPRVTVFTAERNASTPTTVNIRRAGNFSHLAGDNTLTIQVQRRISGGSWTNVTSNVSTSGGSFDASVTSTGNAIASSYDFRVYISDQFGNDAEANSTVSTQYVVLDIHKDEGVGIGKIHEQGVLDVNGEAFFAGRINAISQGDGSVFRLHSPDPNGHGYLGWFGSDGQRKGYLGFPSANNDIMEFRNESGGVIRLTGSALSFNGTQVVASGSNSNGEWVRFYDGTQIAQKRLNLARSVSSTSTELPVSFSNEYGIFLSHNNNDSWAMENVWMFAVGRLNSGAVSLRRYGTPNSGLTWNTQIIITAIGRA